MSIKKRLGILGGMGAEASSLLYQKLIEGTKVEKDQEHLDILLFSHASIPDRTEYILSGKEDVLKAIFKKDIELFLHADCDYLVVPCNTSHYFQPMFRKEFGPGFLSMIDEASAYAVAHYGKKVGVLATDGTVQRDLYGQAVRRCGGECIYPDRDGQKKIMHIIYDEIKVGKTGSLADFTDVVSKLKEAGCDVILLACTELSVLKQQHEQLKDNYYLDAMDVIAKTAIEKCNGVYQGDL